MPTKKNDISTISQYSTDCVGTTVFSEEVLGLWPEHQKGPGLQTHHHTTSSGLMRLFRNIGYNTSHSFFSFIVRLSGRLSSCLTSSRRQFVFSPTRASREHPAPSSLSHQDVQLPGQVGWILVCLDFIPSLRLPEGGYCCKAQASCSRPP